MSECFTCAERGDAISLALLLQKNVDPNERDGFSNTAIFFAALKGHIKCLELLIEHGALINICNRSKCSPLHWACWSEKSLECATLLLRHSPNVHELLSLADVQGDTALHCCAHFELLRAVKVLIKYGANPSHRNLRRQKPEDLSTTNRNIISMLREHETHFFVRKQVLAMIKKDQPRKLYFSLMPAELHEEVLKYCEAENAWLIV